MLSPIHYTEHAADVLAKASTLIQAGKPICLVTSLAIEGGSARACGALAAVADDGEMHGYLSNGCIDRDIQLQAMEALRSGERRLVRYGKGSQFLDLKLPCGGALTVLLDPKPDPNVLADAHTALSHRQLAQMHFSPPREDAGAGVVAKTFKYAPKFRLCLAGRGAVFQAVVRAAAASGFEVYALSPDEEDIDAISECLSAPAQRLTHPGSAVDLSLLDAHSAFLTLFHDHEWETALLREALKSDARFIGCMGSKRAHENRAQDLLAMGVDPEQVERIQGPIGLVPSLRDANLIALSALAQISGLKPNEIVLA